MTLTEISIISGGFAAVVSFLLTLVIKLVSLGYKLGSLTERVDLVFMMLFRRGQVEAVQKGWGMMNSPFQITTEGIDAVAPLLSLFVPWYAELIQNQPNITETKMFEAFERQFGSMIIERICLPQKVSNFACLIAVLEACKEHRNKL